MGSNEFRIHKEKRNSKHIVIKSTSAIPHFNNLCTIYSRPPTCFTEFKLQPLLNTPWMSNTEGLEKQVTVVPRLQHTCSNCPRLSSLTSPFRKAHTWAGTIFPHKLSVVVQVENPHSSWQHLHIDELETSQQRGAQDIDASACEAAFGTCSPGQGTTAVVMAGTEANS